MKPEEVHGYMDMGRREAEAVLERLQRHTPVAGGEKLIAAGSCVEELLVRVYFNTAKVSQPVARDWLRTVLNSVSEKLSECGHPIRISAEPGRARTVRVLQVDQWTSTGDVERFTLEDFELGRVAGGDSEAIRQLGIAHGSVIEVAEDDEPPLARVWFRPDADGKLVRWKANCDSTG